MSRDGFPGATHFTDRQPRPASEVILSARYRLEPEDVDALRAALEPRSVLGDFDPAEPYYLVKRADGGRRLIWKNDLKRDVSPRAQLVAALERETGEGSADLPTATYDDVRIMVVRDLMIATADSLRDKTSEQLEPAALGSLNALRDQLHAWATDAGDPNISLDALRRQVDSPPRRRERDSPHVAAGRFLYGRLPNMLRFDADDRELPAFTTFETEPTRGLVNLLAAAGASFSDLASLAGTADAHERLKDEEQASTSNLSGYSVPGASEVSRPPSQSTHPESPSLLEIVRPR